MKCHVFKHSRVAFWYMTTKMSECPPDLSMSIVGDLFKKLEEQQLLIPKSLFCRDLKNGCKKEISMTGLFRPYDHSYWEEVFRQADRYPQQELFNNDIYIKGNTVLYENKNPVVYEGGFEVVLSLIEYPVFWINVYSTHFMPFYLDASAPNPDYMANYQRFRDVMDELLSKYPDLEVVLDDDYTMYAKMEGLEIKNLTYSDDGSMISIEISDD